MYTLRPYQQQAVDNTLNYFRKSRQPAVIVLPTGAGKSLVIAELARIAKGRVLVLAHVKELVEQNHAKYISYDLEAGIYSAGLNRKEYTGKVIFGSIQSVARASDHFFDEFSLVIIDECHRVNSEGDTQYAQVLKKLTDKNEGLCILGLTATPYRLGMGWIYEYNHLGEMKSQDKKFFKHCVFELPLEYMIKNKFLTQPVKIDIPVTCYDFSEITDQGKLYTQAEVEDILKLQNRLTPLIVKNIVDITENYKRQGVMIFSSSVKHAHEIMQHLPEGEAKLVIGDTENSDRDQIIEEFKLRKFKYLVNVSVLTTGFDAPHVDVIAILRPTDSVSLYQQIIGRGLRLDPHKTDCFILDYTGVGHDIYSPEIGEKKPSKESVPVLIECPKCTFENHFWGLTDDEGNVLEHYGRKCRGAVHDAATFEITPCGYRFRAKFCNQCGAENDISAKSCHACDAILVDADSKLKQARLSKDAHILKPDSFEMLERKDKNGNPFLEIKYYDYDAKALSEFHYLNNSTSRKKFNINFLRSHLKRPEYTFEMTSPTEAIKYKPLYRVPSFIIARKREKYWKITEKIFSEEI
ncbi:MAG: ATP-dependent helicase [Halobacteriovoraceae bacterium]|nr:ATP-dependent helicase [Halobacteriovoraceae bacterium]|tara:strand:+ start:17836 stop:19572 length:1737 start_codon:yes stop_codon:yes gene_type:complete